MHFGSPLSAVFANYESVGEGQVAKEFSTDGLCQPSGSSLEEAELTQVVAGVQQQSQPNILNKTVSQLTPFSLVVPTFCKHLYAIVSVKPPPFVVYCGWSKLLPGPRSPLWRTVW